MARHKNTVWSVPDQPSTEQAILMVLHDIRDELQAIRRLAECHRIPRALDAIVAMHKQGIKRRVVRKRKVKGT